MIISYEYKNYYMMRERATGIMGGRASHTSEYSEAYSNGFEVLLLPSDDDVSPSCWYDRVTVSG